MHTVVQCTAEQVLECRASQNISFLGMARDWNLSQVYRGGGVMKTCLVFSGHYGNELTVGTLGLL